MMIANSTAPLNDAIAADPGTSCDRIHACLEAVRHAVKSCALSTGSPYALVSAKTNGNYARDTEHCHDRIVNNCHHPGAFPNSTKRPIDSLTLRRTNKTTPARRRCHQYALLCSRSLQLMQPVTPGPLQPKDHLRTATQGRSYDSSAGDDSAALHFSDKETTLPQCCEPSGQCAFSAVPGFERVFHAKPGDHAALHEPVLVICGPLGVR